MLEDYFSNEENIEAQTEIQRGKQKIRHDD